MKNIYDLYDDFLVDNAYLSFQERVIQFAKWHTNIRIAEIIDTYRQMKLEGRQLEFDEADIRGTER